MKKDLNKLNVCLMFGGQTVEHDVSIISCFQVLNALDKDKYNIELIYITKNNKMLQGKCLSDLNTFKKGTFKNTKEVTLKNISDVTYIIKGKKKVKVDVFIPVVHGCGVEDGTISAILDFYNATYITSSIYGSAVSQDKIYTKDILTKYGINTPKYIYFNKTEEQKAVLDKLAFPLIIKPARLGSSIGIEKAKNIEELERSILNASKYTDRLIIEEAIDSYKELNIACFKYKDELYLSSIEEVKTTNEFLTFLDKYEENKKSENTNRIINVQLDKKIKTKIFDYTKLIYNILDLRGVIRIDYLYDTKNDIVYFNEVNTIPGSFAFYLYEQKKVTFNIMLDMLIKEAILNKAKESKQVKSFTSNILNRKTLKLKK